MAVGYEQTDLIFLKEVYNSVLLLVLCLTSTAWNIMDSPCLLIKLIKNLMVSELAGDTGTFQLLDKVKFVFCPQSIWVLLNIVKLFYIDGSITLCPKFGFLFCIASPSKKNTAYGFKNFNIEDLNLSELWLDGFRL